MLNQYGILFGGLILIAGVAAILPTLDKKDDESIPFGRYGGMLQVRYVKIFGEILLVMGFFIMITSLF